MENLRLNLLAILVLPIIFLGGCINQGESLKAEFERPYVYKIEKGESVKSILKYPQVNWRYQEGDSCLDQEDYINLIQFLIQLNGTLDQYEAAGERGE